MWTYRQLEKIKQFGVFFRRCVSLKTSSSVPFKFKRALIVSKITKYELEHYHNSHLNNEQIECWLRRRGSDFESLIRSHNLHKKFENFLAHILEKMNVETRIVNRLNYSDSDVGWCDIVIPVGGDGTFLVAANRVRSNMKPIVGLNSDPLRSEGFLCLKKKYSSDVELALRRIFEGKFSWLFRSRIRITLKGLNICEPVQLNEKEVMFKSKSSGFNWSQDEFNAGDNTNENFEEKILPHRALNEVFIGECLSARVSYFDVQLPNRPVTKVKSSGLCICTGTGSSSWYYSMNRLDETDVRLLFKMADVPLSSKKIREILDHYNDLLVFKPDRLEMVYTIRDLISAGVWPDPPGLPSRGTCDRITVRSKCIDAGLVIDGGLLYPFNEGMIAELEVHPEDALRTVILD